MKTRLLALAAMFTLAACAPAPATTPPSVPPTPMPPAPPLPTPTAEPSCPEPTDGTRLLARERMGYCLLYPESFIEVDTDPTQVCLVPGEPFMACHSAPFFINFYDA